MNSPSLRFRFILVLLSLLGLRPLAAQALTMLTPASSYDVEPKIKWDELPAYPYAMLQAETKGRAIVTFSVDARGRLIAAKVEEATHPDFAAATIAMMERWVFIPAQKSGWPIPFTFRLDERYSRFDPDVEDVLRQERDHPETILNPASLDTPLKFISTRAPAYPVTLHGRVPKGEATVEVLIEGRGFVVAPRVISASEPAFGWAAAQAVLGWRFEPPTKKGRPAIARVRIPFEFIDSPDVAPGPGEAKK